MMITISGENLGYVRVPKVQVCIFWTRRNSQVKGPGFRFTSGKYSAKRTNSQDTQGANPSRSDGMNLSGPRQRRMQNDSACVFIFH